MILVEDKYNKCEKHNTNYRKRTQLGEIDSESERFWLCVLEGIIQNLSSNSIWLYSFQMFAAYKIVMYKNDVKGTKYTFLPATLFQSFKKIYLCKFRTKSKCLHIRYLLILLLGVSRVKLKLVTKSNILKLKELR